MSRNKLSLQETNPEIAKQWYYPLNGELSPNKVTSGSTKKVWWKCDKGDDHIWESTIGKRTSGRGCAICRGFKVVKSNCLATTHPFLAKQWHIPLNGDLTPNDVTSGSNKKVWWKCDKGDDHVWESTIGNRSSGRGCAICSNRKFVHSNSLAMTHPQLAEEFHPTLNGRITKNDVGAGSHKKVWWKCEKGDDHIWDAPPNQRVASSGCPICSNRRTVKSNSICTTHPKLAMQWHPSLNGKLTPNDVVVGTPKKFWWICDKGDDHIWKTSPHLRSKDNTGCPICVNKKIVSSNRLSNTHPKLAMQWHPSLNGDLTPNDVVVGTPKKFWWICDKGDDHIWKASPHLRSKDNTGCPFCTLTPQSRQELIITFELKQFFEINPKGFKTRVNNKLWSVDIYIPLINLGVEFDGAYWHKDKEDFDKLKTRQLNEIGLNIIRVRQSPLEQIFENDILTSKVFNGKDITNKILRHILSDFSVEEQNRSKIEVYLNLDVLQNEQELNNYIEKILIEKSKRKINLSPIQ